ncbi:hypothetical protein Q2E61_13750 [Microbulbifer thermotolerans]|uniref:hypothetical protein n=1 Tax=Microbulbifer thermotolerans TaxID=252514 RepID=UPI00267391C0|nr:hypothetical protein [Microbulbifer thermotolerans]WKT59958.1 hypothetical protein Q2E61_13750 [Microbulbifer thermotolerans]
MRVAKILFTAFSAVIMGGCDTIYGVSRYSPVGVIRLPIECMVEATKSVAGVSGVEHRVEEGGRELTFSGIQQPEIIDRFLYTYDGLNGNYYFRTNYKGISEFQHTYIEINRRPLQSEIDKIRPVMIKIENSVSQRCQIDISKNAIENCMGVTCEDI